MAPVNHQTMGSAALAYADIGFAVFPLVPRTKEPMVAGGFKAATTNEQQVKEWWDWQPLANVGIATGAVNRLVVIDQDPRNGGDESLPRLVQDLGLSLDTPTVVTGGGGRHFYFSHPGGDPIPCRRDFGGYEGIDLKADGGYVVAAPSIHPDTGRQYQWDESATLEMGMPHLHPPVVTMARDRISPNPTGYVREEWSGRLPDSVAQAVAWFPKIGRRFHRDPAELVDTSDSGIDMSLACQLARCGFTGAEIEAGIRVSRQLVNSPSRPRTYYDSTVGKAISLASMDRGNA